MTDKPTHNKTIRGFSAVAVDSPKFASNLGGVLRAAGNYNSSLVVFGDDRVGVKERSDTMKAYRHIPTIRTNDIFSVIPYDCVPVAVDLIEGAIPLPEYKHPERAFYIFGGEDRTLGKRITEKCRDVIYVPTNRCMNLAAAVNVVLYDRLAKLYNQGGG